MEDNEINPWATVALAVSTQTGPDGKHMVSIHLGTPALSAALVFPPEEDQVEALIKTLTDELRMQAKNARIKNSGIIIRSNGRM